MTHKTKKQILEYASGKNKFISMLAEKCKQASNMGISIPQEIINEINSFSIRNSIVKAEPSNVNCFNCANYCCIQCIRAHIYANAKSIGLDNFAVNFLLDLFPGKIGHEGYYLDEEKLIKI